LQSPWPGLAAGNQGRLKDDRRKAQTVKLKKPVTIRQGSDADRPAILAIHRKAFPDESVDALTDALLADPTAEPMVSLVAVVDDKPVGHVLFTAAVLKPETAYRVSLLAPLGVIPDYQRQGIGGMLIAGGLACLRHAGVRLVFVLGHPAYYPRFGFVPAGERGFAAPYPIPAQHADAWMMHALCDGLPESYSGTVNCASALDRPEYWRE